MHQLFGGNDHIELCHYAARRMIFGWRSSLLNIYGVHSHLNVTAKEKLIDFFLLGPSSRKYQTSKFSFDISVQLSRKH
jgi:hypothetical protein